MTWHQLSPGIVSRTVPQRPGVYLLAAGQEIVYVGRSEFDIRSRLKQHLPWNEEDPCLQRSSPNLFAFRVTSSAQEACKLERLLYLKHNPRCNDLLPARS